MSRFVGTIAIFLAAFVGSASCALAGKRVALVIGNAEYPRVQRLLNPRNDAEDMADTLKSLGFDVILRVNAGKQGFTQGLAEFSRAVTGAKVGLFFYSGHAMQFQGRNYLMPTDAELTDEVSLRYELIALDEVQQALDRSNGTRVMILDACRNNPFATQFARSITTANRDAGMVRGLARMEQARGRVVAYSTQANEVAEDGLSRNSPFTGALLESLREPGLEIGTMFRKVAARVYEDTNGKQIPELSISLLSEVYLNRNESAAQAWSRVRAGNDPGAVRDFLSRFPASFYAADARMRLDMMDSAARERELRDRLTALEVERQKAELELANQKAAAALADRARVSAVEVAKAEARLAELQKQMQNLTVQANDAAAAQEARRQQMAALNPEKPIDVDEGKLVYAIETELRRLGCYSASMDSNWQNPAIRKAIADFAIRTRLAKVPENPTPELLDDLKARGGPVCAPACGPRERENNGSCVAKTCAASEVLNRDGECVPRAERKSARSATASAPRPHRAEPSAAPARSGRGGCFNFNGRQFC
jgi:hypothetical protein